MFQADETVKSRDFWNKDKAKYSAIAFSSANAGIYLTSPKEQQFGSVS